MSKPNEDRDVYYIPPNFLTSGRLFGGMIRARNAIEACVLVLLTGVPIIKLPFSLTTRIIILCLVSLPLGIFGVIGFEGDSLSEFAVNWVRWLIHRRTLYRSDTPVPEAPEKPMKAVSGMSAPKPPEQLGIKIKEKPKKRKKRNPVKKPHKASKHKSSVAKKKQPLHAEDFISVRDIRNGIIETTDGRYLRVIEVEPINFLLRNISEQKNIVASFASWMKISPVKVQIKVLTKKADIGKHLNTIEREMEAEDNPKCRDLQLDYYHLIQTIGSREAITRRFLVIFEYEAVTNRKPGYAEIVSALETAVQTARQYFLHCDNAVVAHEDENIFLMEVLYTIFNRATCEVKPVEKRVRELQAARKDTDISVPVPLKSVLAPESIDLTHGYYVVMDGVYHAYLIVPSDGYNPRVVAGWTSILVNAGEGIDVDFFFSREPKERIQAKLGQQIRINRSRLKDTSDTNTDFDDFESAIRSGYFLKEGLANYEDFYYCNTLVTVTADTLENLEWRISEVRRLTTAEYKGTVVSSGISSILYTVTYLGTKIEPTKAEPTFKGAVLVISIIGGTALLAALLFLGLTLRKNTTVYKATGKGNEYEKCGRLHLKAKNPELRIDRLKDIPEGVIAIEVDQAVAKKLFGQTIAIRCYDNTVGHTVGEVNGSYWFKVDIGSQEDESNYEEEP